MSDPGHRPISDTDLKYYDEVADNMNAEGLPVYAAIIRELLAEVERLKAKDRLVSDLIHASVAVLSDADDDENGDDTRVDTSRIRYLEAAVDAFGPLEDPDKT